MARGPSKLTVLFLNRAPSLCLLKLLSPDCQGVGGVGLWIGVQSHSPPDSPLKVFGKIPGSAACASDPGGAVSWRVRCGSKNTHGHVGV